MDDVFGASGVVIIPPDCLRWTVRYELLERIALPGVLEIIH